MQSSAPTHQELASTGSSQWVRTPGLLHSTVPSATVNEMRIDPTQRRGTSAAFVATLNSMYGYCVAVAPTYSKKNTGRLQHGDCAPETHRSAAAPVSATPVPRLAHAEQVAAEYGMPEHVVVLRFGPVRTVASLVMPAMHVTPSPM